MDLVKKGIIFVIIILSVLKSNAGFSQQLTIFNIDTTKYPSVTADFFAIDNLENQITTLTKDDVIIKENLISQHIVKVVNPATVKPKQLSLVLTIDISESMSGAYMQLAKSAATAIVNKLPLDISECAITSFDDASFINADFTRDREKLLKTIRALTPHGGTNYDKGFLKPHAGGLDILKNGLHEKVLIFLTDGYGDVSPAMIIQKAKTIGAKVYVITVGMSAPDELKRIVSATNGTFYENVISEDEINAAYLSILYRSQGLTPSTVEWISAPDCGYSKKLFFGENKSILRPATAQYKSPAKNSIRLISKNPNTITFNTERAEISVPLKAINGDFTIHSFNSSNAKFTLAEPVLPHTIKKEGIGNFIIKHTGTSDEFVSGRIELTSMGCQSTFIYFQHQPNSDKPSINLVMPDGKETFFIGEDTLIRWNLQNSTTPVKISFSDNAGIDWQFIADSCKSDYFKWKIPNKPGTNNLIKIETVVAEQKIKKESKVVYDGFTDVMNAYNLSPDGSRYISQTTTELVLYDTYTNTVINKIKNTVKNGYFIFSPDGRYIFTYDENKPIKVYDGYTFEFIEDWGIFKNTLSSYIEPYINNDLSQYVAKDVDGSLGIFDFKTGAKIKSTAFVKGKEVTDFTQNYIVSLEEGDHHVWVWDYRKGNRVLEISVPQDRIVNAELNADETVLLVYTWGNNGANQNFTAYNLNGKQLYSYKNTSDAFMSQDTYLNYSICSVADKPALINMNTGEVQLTYLLPEPVKFGWFVPFSNGKYVLFTSAVSSKVYMLTSGIEDTKNDYVIDQSSAVFTILSAKPIVQKINFAGVYVGNVKDSVVRSCIMNTISYGITIKEISIEGNDAASFKILNPTTSFKLESLSNLDVEIRFAPVKSGFQQAILKVITMQDTVRVSISGTGIIKPYKIQSDELNLGLVEVGKIKDTVLTKMLTNTSSKEMHITAIHLMGPDKIQFKILSPTAFIVPSGAFAEIKLRFSPIQRGRTSTQLNIAIQNSISEVTIPIYAEGYLPRQYIVQLNFVDAATKMAIPATVTCIDRQSNKSIECVSIDNGNGSTINAYADRIYVFAVSKQAYKQVIDSINLLEHIADIKINKVIELIADRRVTPITKVLSGKVFIKSTQSPLWAFISFYDPVTKVLVKKVESEPDGTFSVALPVSIYNIQLEKEGYVNENTTIEIINESARQTMNFELLPIKVGETISLPNVYFARGGVELFESSNESLNQLYTLLIDNPTMRIELLGYTDNQGDPRLNIALSEQRVAAIKEYLVAKGISETRIIGKGYGGSKPIASNATEETRKLNRRVEFKIISK